MAIFLVSEDSNIALCIQPHLFGFFCFIVYLQVMYYPPIERSKKDILWRGGLFLLFQIAIEVGCIIPFRRLHSRGVTWPILMFGIIANVVLIIGLIPPYFELWKRNGRVIGINFGFLSMDIAGAVFSLLSLITAKGKLDIMGCVIYSVVGCMELGIMVSHLVWMVRFRGRHQDDELEEDVDNDDLCSCSSIRESKLDIDTQTDEEQKQLEQQMPISMDECESKV